MKNRKGFTLVEAVVVAVIIGIMAIVAGTLYNGYINDARQTTVQNLAETAAAAASSYWRKTGSDPSGTSTELIQRLNLYFPDPSKIEVTVTGNQISVRNTAYNKTGTANFR